MLNKILKAKIILIVKRVLIHTLKIVVMLYVVQQQIVKLAIQME